MKISTTQFLLSMSLATVTLSAPSAVQPPVTAGRNKRSFFSDHGQRQFSRQHMNKLLRKAKSESKRGGFDNLDLDMLLNDPFFMELEAEHENQMNMNTLEQPSFPGVSSDFDNGLESDLHGALGPGLHNGMEPNLHKAIGSDLQHGLGSELHNGLGSGSRHGLNNGMPNGLENMLGVDVVPPPKNEMSNVIPGARGPFEREPSRRMQDIADNMMDEFMDFLTLKEMGLLDSCLGVKRR